MNSLHRKPSGISRPGRPGRPRRDEAQAISERIVEVAWSAFAEKGWDGVSLDEIARQAGVSKRTLYDRFSGKEGLFDAVCRAASFRLAEKVARLRPRGADAPTKIEALAIGFLDAALGPANLPIERLRIARRWREAAGAADGLSPDLAAFAARARKLVPGMDGEGSGALLTAVILPALGLALGGSPSAARAHVGRIVPALLSGRGEKVSASVERASDGARGRGRARMVGAAARRFAAASYDNVGLRDIAADAQVDVAHLHRSFGSKEALFIAALEHAAGPEPLGDLRDGVSLPDRVLKLFRDADSRDVQRGMSLAIMTSSLNSPTAAAVLRAGIREGVIEPMASTLPVPGETRASLAMCLLFGLAIGRFKLDLPGLDPDRPETDRIMRGLLDAISLS